ncbi:MAG: nuclear transport factor 2 family protein [Gemmatimonadales bacterium]
MRATLFVAALALAAPTALAQAPATPLEVAERQIATFNARDLDGFMALYAEDAVLSEFPSGRVLANGKAAIRARFAQVIEGRPANFPPVRVEPRVVDGAFVVDHERWDAPAGERNSAVWMYEIRDGLIRKSWQVIVR